VVKRKYFSIGYSEAALLKEKLLTVLSADIQQKAPAF
jgi:hypothetical protein